MPFIKTADVVEVIETKSNAMCLKPLIEFCKWQLERFCCSHRHKVKGEAMENRLMPTSSVEDVLKASPEERKRWADDMIARSNQAIAEEEQEEQLARQLLNIFKDVRKDIAIRSLEDMTKRLKEGEVAFGT